MITCSEKCVYEYEGLCTLKKVSKASDTPTKDCPFFIQKSGRKEIN